MEPCSYNYRRWLGFVLIQGHEQDQPRDAVVPLTMQTLDSYFNIQSRHNSTGQPQNSAGSATSVSNCQYDIASSLGGSGESHHKFNEWTIGGWLYPEDLEIREYQRVIARRALYENIICALPTGMGKTFIANVVMSNWYRWTETAKLVFMAPTKPLVAQQYRNFLETTEVSAKDTTMLLQDVVKKKERSDEWKSKRVIFSTPQTVDNDLKAGIVDPMDFVCIVVDEAHRATGNYSYVNIVRKVTEKNSFCRILALTATPSNKLPGVQSLVSNLHASGIEIRSEESHDIVPYLHEKEIKKVQVDLSPLQLKIAALVSKMIAPQLKQLAAVKIVFSTDALKIHPYQLMDGTRKYMAMNRHQPASFMVSARAKALHPVLYALTVLQNHGVYQFYVRFKEILDDFTANTKPGRPITEICQAKEFDEILALCEQNIYIGGTQRDPEFVGHPKMHKLIEMLGDYLNEHPRGQAIIFTDLRETAVEVKYLLDSKLSVQCKVFVGQAQSAGGEKGLTQAEQRALLDRFKEGQLNVLVATSVAEEGLDISQVDAVFCYDQSSSSIRSIQRMGRTARARNGLAVLLMSAKEEQKLERAMADYKKIQREVQSPKNKLKYVPSKRILPDYLDQKYLAHYLDIPPENKGVESQLQSKRRKVQKPEPSSTSTQDPSHSILPSSPLLGPPSVQDELHHKQHQYQHYHQQNVSSEYDTSVISLLSDEPNTSITVYSSDTEQITPKNIISLLSDD